MKRFYHENKNKRDKNSFIYKLALIIFDNEVGKFILKRFARLIYKVGKRYK